MSLSVSNLVHGVETVQSWVSIAHVSMHVGWSSIAAGSDQAPYCNGLNHHMGLGAAAPAVGLGVGVACATSLYALYFNCRNRTNLISSAHSPCI